MSDACEIYAIKYARNPAARRQDNFIGGDPHDAPMPLDYFVWAIVGEGGTFVVDTGFTPAMGAKRKRDMLRPPAEGLKALGIGAEDVRDVILTHMHYDHAGNQAMFPNARFHLQDREMAYCTGRCMCHHALNHPFEPEDVTEMVRSVFQGRVTFHDGDSEVAPGITVHRVGGHSDGLQIVRVRTRRGWVVLASDATHFYANIEEERPFPVVVNIADMLEGFSKVRRLASSPDHIIPGHDPLVGARYPAAAPGLEDWVLRLDADPR